jgi:hypothetical protein
VAETFVRHGVEHAIRKAVLSAEQLQRRFHTGSYRLNEDLELEKRCSHCRSYWPADTEFFYPKSDEPDGLFPWCKACYQDWRQDKRIAAEERSSRTA